MAETNWRQWHTQYDDPSHSLSRRLTTVRRELDRVLRSRGDRPTQLVSICSGDGRDTLPVLAAGYPHVAAVLVELDEDLAGAARAEAGALGLPAVDVRAADAGATDTYVAIPGADVFLACGVFGNVTDGDLEATVATLPGLLTPNARVIWTRGDKSAGDPTSWPGDPADLVRELLARHHFVEEEFVRPANAGFRVGVHRFAGTPGPLGPGGRMFRFVR